MIYIAKNAGSLPATGTATCRHTPVPVLHMPGYEEIIKFSVYRECQKIINKINIMIYIAKMPVARWQLAHPHACTLPCWFYECWVEINAGIQVMSGDEKLMKFWVCRVI